MIVVKRILSTNFQTAKKAKGPAKKQVLRGKGQKKKVSLKFTIDCTHPVEDNIMDVGNFVSFMELSYNYRNSFLFP